MIEYYVYGIGYKSNRFHFFSVLFFFKATVFFC